MLKVYRESGPIRQHVVLVAEPMFEKGLVFGEETLTPEWLKENLQPGELPKDLFAKDAKIIVIGCFAGYSKKGEEQISIRQKLVDIYSRLSTQGASLVTTTRFAYVNPEAAPYNSSLTTQDRIAHRLMIEVGFTVYDLMSAYYLSQADTTTQENRILTITIPAK